MTSRPRETRPPRSRRPRPLDVALIGMACRYPGAADVNTFWRNILSGRDSIRDVPPDRWDADLFCQPDANEPDRVYCRRGGYLDSPVTFDPSAHGIMPLAVAGGEPEQFLILDAARAALDDAGYLGGVPHGARVEVVIGRGNYFNRGNLTRLQHGRIIAQTVAILRALHPEWSEADFEAVRADLRTSLPPFEAGTIAGQLTNATSGRVSNRLDLKGASFVVDAASASSLVALDLAARALVERRADLAIVGGVYLQPDVDFPLVFSRLGALSRAGSARPFTATADGTLPGEGVGVVILKRLADAERDRNRVYAVVKGVGLASDGRATGLAAPSARGHALAMKRAYRGAGIDPATIDLIEGHGLGVPASDRAELRALGAVFPPGSRGGRYLGAVSAQIGHAMPAAGMAGLIKTALALHHRVIPASSHADDPHPLLRAESAPFQLNPVNRPWVHGRTGHPRRAGVNAFGFAGVNAHAILEEYEGGDREQAPGAMLDWDSEAILLGAPDRAHWLELASALLDWLDSGQNVQVSLKDLAYTLNLGQSAFPFRVGMVVESPADLRDRLRAVMSRLRDPNCRSLRDARGTYFWEEPLAGPGRLAFLYPGEGSQYPRMLADLFPHFPELWPVFDTADRIALERGRERLPSELLFGSTSDDAGLWAIDTAVTVVLTSQWALHILLTRLGLRPDAVVGHSSGELLALAGSGVIQADHVLEERLGELGSIFEGLERQGRIPGATLVAIAADRDRVEAVCREAGVEPRIAMDNCPHQVVWSGTAENAAVIVARLRSQAVLCETLPYARAYHTADFAPALGPVSTFFEQLPMQQPHCPVYSCATAAPMKREVDAIRRLAIEQWCAPVAFRSTLERMHEDGVRLFVEVGARGNLTGFVEDTLRGRPHFAVAANLPRRSGLTQLNHLVAALHAQGVSLQTSHLYARRRPRVVDLSCDLPISPPAPELKIGFPEMRLSHTLVERLTRRAEGLVQKPREESAPASTPTPPRSNGTPLPDWDAPAPAIDLASAISSDPHVYNRMASRISGPAHASRPVTEADAAMLAYLHTMDEFLNTQRQVMDAYLGSQASATEEVVNDALESPIDFTAAIATPARSEPVAPPPSSPSLQVDEILLQQVSQRTGYPREMLGLDLDMEGDLGIDSIKRVEILGELQNLGVVPDGVDLERLSRCRTLGQVLDILKPPDGRIAQSRSVETVAWVGDVERYEPGRELVAVRWLVADEDPVASHHTLGGRRLSAVAPERLGLPVVPFTIMAELLAQAAAALCPGQVVVGLRDVQANRWIPYESEPLALEIHAIRDSNASAEVRVTLRNRGVRGSRKGGADLPTVSGVVVFGTARPQAPVATPWHLERAGTCRFEAGELYRDQWLFHGPALQALKRVGQSSPHGIEGTLEVLPRRELLPDRLWPELHTDPIVLDAFTHLLGCWGIDKQAGQEGDVIFPLRLAQLRIFEQDPPEGTRIECQIRVREVTRHRVRIDAELVRPDGRIWMALDGWEDWRFYWPERYRDVFRQPETIFVGEPTWLSESAPRAVLVWVEPPPDMGKPVWRDVLEWTQLEPGERLANHAAGESEPEFSLRIWERVAAKEAVRRLWFAQGLPPIYPADLVIDRDAQGRALARSLVAVDVPAMPALTFAHAEGVAVALACDNPATPLGIDVARMDAVETDAAEVDPNEMPARLESACRAAASAFGIRVEDVTIVDVDRSQGEVHVRVPSAAGSAIRVATARRGDHVWAWTLGERV